MSLVSDILGFFGSGSSSVATAPSQQAPSGPTVPGAPVAVPGTGGLTAAGISASSLPVLSVPVTPGQPFQNYSIQQPISPQTIVQPDPRGSGLFTTLFGNPLSGVSGWFTSAGIVVFFGVLAIAVIIVGIVVISRK